MFTINPVTNDIELTKGDTLRASVSPLKYKNGDSYVPTEGDRIRYGEMLYKCIQAHTSQDSWTPDVTAALWTRVTVEEWPEWAQPTGATDAYMTGDKVSYEGQHYVSTIDYNTWPPTVYGWEVVQ